jgi:tetratricopeptide (TPR) repeat protein
MQQDEPNTESETDAQLRAAIRSIRAGEASNVLARLTGILAVSPGNDRARYALAAAQLRSGNPAAALAEFETLLDQAPAHDGAAYGRGLALFALGERRAALGVFRHLTKPGPVASRAWASIADITPYEADRQQALHAAADLLKRHCELSGAVEDRRAAAEALLAARRPQEAGALLMSCCGPVSGAPMPDQLLARAWYHQGCFEAAFIEAARLLASTCANPVVLRPLPAFAAEKAVSVLVEILEVLAEAGVTAFLAAGTLLGFRRSHGPLAHDRDIDIGVIRNPDGGPDIAAILRTHDRILLPRISRPGDRYFGLQYRGVGVDIFLYDPAGRHLMCGFSDTEGDIQWRFTGFAIDHADLGGRRWPVPGMPERYLAETYGPGWQVPDRAFASAVSSPALYRTDAHARGYYAASRARAALIDGDTDKAGALIRQSPVPLPVPAARRREPS